MMWRGAAVGRLSEILELGLPRRWSLSGAGTGGVIAGGIAASPGQGRVDGRARVGRDACVEAVPRPLHADWAWRPMPWSGPVDGLAAGRVASGAALGHGVKLFHDCPRGDCAVRRLRDAETARGIAGIEIEVGRFEGGFLSLAIDLPPAAVNGLSRRHLVGVAMVLEVAHTRPVYARLNVRHGPNLAQVVQGWDGGPRVDLDLAVLDLDEDRVASAWVDLIFEAPAMTRITLRDVTLSRRPRAEF
mgnify:FL=1